MKNNRLYSSNIPRKWYHNFIVLPLFIFLLITVSQLIGSIIQTIIPLNEPLNFIIYGLYINFGIITLILFAIIKYRENRSPLSIGLKHSFFALKFLRGYLLGFILFSIIVFTAILTNNISLTLNSSLSTSYIIYIFLFLGGFIVQSSTEEILTRGYMMQIFANRYSLGIGVFASSLYFAFLHLLNPSTSILSTLNIALFGIFAAVISIYRKEIYTVCGLHAAWNFTQGNIYGVSVSGLSLKNISIFNATPRNSVLLSGGSFGLEASVITTIIFVLGIAYYLNKIYKSKLIKTNLK